MLLTRRLCPTDLLAKNNAFRSNLTPCLWKREMCGVFLRWPNNRKSPLRNAKFSSGSVRHFDSSKSGAEPRLANINIGLRFTHVLDNSITFDTLDTFNYIEQFTSERVHEAIHQIKTTFLSRSTHSQTHFLVLLIAGRIGAEAELWKQPP